MSRLGQKITMRTCRHCEEKFDPVAEPTKACRNRRDPARPGVDLSCEPKPRGFAALSPERVSEIAHKGGQMAHAKGTAHKFSREEASAAGRVGGNAPHVRRGPVKKSA